MRTKTFITVICLTAMLLSASNLRADSDFLSSDVFYNYRSYETAKKTSENGISEKEYLDYLLSEGHTLGEKVALVSALSSYFEFKDFDDNSDNDSEEDYFVRYAEEFDQLLNTMIIYDSDNSMLPELRLLSVLMSDYRTFSPNVTAYDRLAEEMPQSLAAQSVKVSAFAYDVLYNEIWDRVDEFETDYLNPYLAASSAYIKDADLQIVANVEEWLFYIYQRRVDFYPELEEEFMKKFAHKFTSVSGVEAVAAAEKAVIADSLIQSFVSPIRPGEKLKMGESYIDEFEFDYYSDESDFNVFIVHKPGSEQVGLFDYIESGLNHSFSRGDRVRIEWRIDTAYAPDDDVPFLHEYVTKVTKITEQ